MSNQAHRRLFGTGFGLLIGFIFGLGSQGINHLWLPGVPLYHPPFGLVGNVLLTAAFGAVVGLTTAWPKEGPWGVFWGSLLGTVVLFVVSLVGGADQEEGFVIQVISLTIILLPLAGACAIPLVIFRWILSREMHRRLDYPVWSWQRAVLPALVLVGTGLSGLYFAYPALGRTVTAQMYELIVDGQEASSEDALPEPLRSRQVIGFFNNSRGRFELAWESDPDNHYRIARRFTNPYTPSTVVAHFENGWILACVYSNTVELPSCKSFYPGE